MKIVLDAMGGDNAPDANIKGAVNAINKVKAEIILVGKEEVSRDRDADHIADVVVREHRDGERYHIQLVPAVFYQRVDSEEDERQKQ